MGVKGKSGIGKDIHKIKFRTWEDNFMNYNPAFYQYSGRDQTMQVDINEIFNTKRLFMQFTGFIDKDNNEIYEGDIVLNDITGWKKTVAWNQSNGGWNIRAGSVHKTKCWSIKVIGNICEDRAILARI